MDVSHRLDGFGGQICGEKRWLDGVVEKVVVSVGGFPFGSLMSCHTIHTILSPNSWHFLSHISQ